MDGTGMQKAADDSLVVMVDQLWIWALDAGTYTDDARTCLFQMRLKWIEFTKLH
jgi:hypothetical protein